jgi:hypothetical protein
MHERRESVLQQHPQAASACMSAGSAPAGGQRMRSAARRQAMLQHCMHASSCRPLQWLRASRLTCSRVRLQGLAVAARFPPDSATRAGQAESQEEAILAEEQEAAMEEQRQELFVLLRNTARLIPKQAVESVQKLLQTLVGAPDGRADAAAATEDPPVWQDVEVAVVLLYELGEALTEEVNSDRCGVFQEPVALLMAGHIPHLTHRLVAGAVLECYVCPPRFAQRCCRASKCCS